MATFTATVTAGDVAATLTDYPAYVDLSEMPASFWSEVTNGGGDIRVYSDAGLSTELAREVVTCATATDTGEVHVKVPSLTTSTVLYITVDGAASEPSASSTYGSQAVWTGYTAVHHMNESSGSMLDSTSNGEHGTFQGNLPTPIDAVLGKGQSLDGTGDYITSPLTQSDFAGLSSLTASAWMNSSTSSRQAIFSTISGGDSVFGIDLWSDGRIRVAVYRTTGGYLTLFTSASTYADGENHLVAFRYTGNRLAIIVDGAEENSTTFTTSTIKDENTGTNLNLKIGEGTSHEFLGVLDEARIFGEVSTDWHLTEYNNQSDVAGFWTIAEASSFTPSPMMHLLQMM